MFNRNYKVIMSHFIIATVLLPRAEGAVRVPISDVGAGEGEHAAVNRKCSLRSLLDETRRTTKEKMLTILK